MQLTILHEPLKKDVLFVGFFSIIIVFLQFCLRYFQSEIPSIMTFREGLLETVSTFLLAIIVLGIIRHINTTKNIMMFINTHLIIAVIYSITSVLFSTFLLILYTRSNVVNRLFDHHVPYSFVMNFFEYIIIFCVAYSIISINGLKSIATLIISDKIINEDKGYLKRIIVNETNRINILKVENIISIEASIDYTKLIKYDNSYFIDTHKMHYFEDRLDPNQFIRIHRSTIINIDSIKDINIDSNNRLKVTLANNLSYRVSKTGQKKLKELGNNIT